jgi:glycosyltransferase involved in cell wall biosynthesis
MTGPVVHFLVPDGVDDDERVSGGNVYDRRLAEGLRRLGLDVRMMPVAVGRVADAASATSWLPDDALVLVDGLLGVAASEVLAAQAARLRVVVLAHMVAALVLEGDAGRTAAREREALRAARRVITTSEWTRSELIERDIAEPERVVVARPGVDAVPASPGSRSGEHLLCIGAIAAHKGQDVLVAALAGLADVPGWTCSIVGSLDADAPFASRTADALVSAGLSDRVTLSGVLTGSRLDEAYRTADLVVAPSRAESYGMVVAEALARGIPVVAAHVGGIPEAIAGRAAGILVAPEDADALRAVLRRWLEDTGWRAALKAEAMATRGATRSWEQTAAITADVLREVAANGALEERRVAR